MATIELTQGKVTTVPDECFEFLTELGSWYANRIGRIFYATCNIRLPTGKPGKMYLHNAVWEFCHGAIPPGFTVDHRDRDSLNNSLDNLRLATRSQQNANRQQPNKTTGQIGVHCVANGRRKYAACIGIDGKQKYLGVFHRPEAAALARDLVALQVFGEFAVLNNPNLKPDT